VLDTGDALVGGVSLFGDDQLGELTQGKAIIDGMNLMGYDAMALGPLDLSPGPSVLAERMTQAQFPMVSANVKHEGTGELLAEPYVVVSLGQHRVAIVGLTRVPNEPVVGFQILDPIQAATVTVAEAAQQADTVILLTNLEYDAAISLAENLAEVDLVIAALPTQVPKAVERTVKGTLVVTADQPDVWGTGQRVGRLLVKLDSSGRLSDEQWESIVLDQTIPDDPDMKALLESYQP